MPQSLEILSQRELLKILRSKLSNTDSDLVSNLSCVARVQSLIHAIQPATWKMACEQHFSLLSEQLEKADAKMVYLQYYPAHRFNNTKKN